jgi:hypothetical protein
VATVFPGATPPAPIPDLPTFWAETPVTIASREVSGVTVSLVPGARLSGRLVFNGTTPKPSPEQLQRLTVNLTPVGDEFASTLAIGGFHIRTAQVTATGEIRSYQIPPGSYLIRASPLPGWTFADAMLDGTDVSSIPFDAGRADVAGIVLSYTDKPAELAGTVRDGMRPDGTATVLIFPTDERGWRNDPGSRRLRTAAAGPDGSFRFAAVPVGEYFAIAVRDADVEEWEAPATLARLAALATRLTIAEGESRVQDLTVKQMRSR